MSGRTGRPRSRVLRLRRWLLAIAIVFALLLVSVIGYTRYRALRARLDLPKQLGIDVRSEANAFTISRSGKDGRPLFTIHGSKAIQHQNGITTLRDVAVTLYGPAGSNRTDSIRGAEFEYDQKNGVLRAVGETLLDVGIAEGSNARSDAKRLTMQGKGLVFLQKLGVASTKEQIRFQYGASQGEAVGADYDTDTGVVTLQHDVHLHSTENGSMQRIDAAAAELNRNTRVAVLQNATVTQGDESMQAPHIVAKLRQPPDEHAGTLETVDASGGVVLHTASGERAQAPELHADVTAENKLALVTMQGGVHLQDAQNQGSAQRAFLRFSGGVANHLTLAGDAHVQQVADSGSRTLEATTVDSSLVTTTSAHVSLGEIHANGAAKLLILEPGKQPGQIERTELTGPELVAHAVPGERTSQIRDVKANHGAHLVQDDGHGTVRTSSSDDLFAAFHATGATTKADKAELDLVVQHGHVILHEARPATAAQNGLPARSASTTDATAQVAEYQASTDLLVLTGSPHVSGDGLQLSATRVSIHRDSGDAEANGAVRGSFAQASTAPAGHAAHGAGTTEFVGESVRMTHSTGAVLLQGGSGDARLWSDTGQVEAPTIEADQKANTLHAFGAAGGGAATVKTVLMQSSSITKTSAAAPGRTRDTEEAHGAGGSEAPTRVFSRDLVYRGGTSTKPGTAEFRGGVRVIEGIDVITADSATAVLEGSAGTSTASAGNRQGMLASSLQTITAEGHVRVQQGARVATGGHLVYTARTRDAVLTGSAGALPVVRDPMQGVLTGTQLVLHLGPAKGDNQVEVTGAPNTPVHTELDVPEKGSAQSSTQPRSPAARRSRPTP